MKFNQALKQSLVTMEKVFEVSIWSIMARIARFHFWNENFPLSFLLNRSNILQVLYLIVFFSPCSFQRYIICEFSSHRTIITIFRFWEVEQAGGTVASYCSNENFRIWPLSILILNLSRLFADFLISLLLLNCFSKILLSKLHQNLLKFFLKYNKFMVIFIYHFTPWSSIN
jgi:hypothetical protein